MPAEGPSASARRSLREWSGSSTRISCLCWFWAYAAEHSFVIDSKDADFHPLGSASKAILEIPRLRFLYQPRMIHIHILQQKPGKRFYKPGLQVGLSKSSQERTSPGSSASVA